MGYTEKISDEDLNEIIKVVANHDGITSKVFIDLMIYIDYVYSLEEEVGFCANRYNWKRKYDSKHKEEISKLQDKIINLQTTVTLLEERLGDR